MLVDLVDGVGGEMNAITGFGISLLNEDTYTSIENITGSQNTDILMGYAGTNVIDGGGGADLLLGEGGNDVLHGGTGDDLISAGSNVGETSQLFGDDGNDTLFGSAGKDAWTAARAMTGSTTPQPVDGRATETRRDRRSRQHGYGGWAEGDTYVNIENARGTIHDDVLLGDGNANILGGAGSNIVRRRRGRH